ncbi:MAG TPA: DUF4102 domain-containing protein [Desulfuromonadales bacterium]|nr:DUF4102 domain-containing protein [Desulfuromonadales bacterium]
MPKLKLTKSNLDKLEFPASGQVDYWDTELPGFGLRVGKETKTFMVKVDVKVPVADGSQKPYKTVKEMIGRYGVCTPEQARGEAVDRIKKIKAGMPTTDAPPVILTLSEMADRYLKDNTRSVGTEKKYSALFKTGVFSEWGKLPINVASEIEPDVIIGVFSQVSKDNGLFSGFPKSCLLQPSFAASQPCSDFFLV